MQLIVLKDSSTGGKSALCRELKANYGLHLDSAALPGIVADITSFMTIFLRIAG